MTSTSSKKLDCGHIFHLRCIKQWIQSNTTCPVCRNELIEERRNQHEHRRNENWNWGGLFGGISVHIVTNGHTRVINPFNRNEM